MSLKQKLENSIGKSIAAICPNAFHDRGSNHCAHYASHMVDLQFTYNCVQYKGGSGQAGNIRVHEIFAQCPLVGRFDQADINRTQLVFVTRNTNVKIDQKWMGNIPQKHIGVYCDGHIYHYSNGSDQVKKWTPERFLSVFQDYYSGEQELYFGTIPGMDLELTVDSTGQQVDEGIAFALRKSGKEWFAKTANSSTAPEFFVGREVHQVGPKYYGIFLPSARYYGHRFRAADYFDAIDQWAVLMELTGYCESRNYMNLINTYDRAKFTYGFYQLAAHTPNDNLILLFRELLRLGAAKDYFPELQLVNERVHLIKSDGGHTNLETSFDGNLQFFMNFLNPRRVPIDEQEILNAARLMHWTENDPECRLAQVRVSAEILQRKMAKRYHRWYDLDGRSDTICAIIADIHHQGRASKRTVQDALAQADQRAALLTVNDSKYGARNQRLAAKVDRFEAEGRLGRKTYDAGANLFVD